MKRVLFSLLAVCGLSMPDTGLAQSNATLNGLDTQNEALAWQAVGRLDAQMNGFCTATLISPELVLTAAHCVFSKQTKKVMKGGALTFKAGLRKGTSVAERKVAQVEVHPGYDHSLGTTVQNVRHDVALLRLAEPIPTHVLSPFVVHGSEMTHGPVSVVSYGRGRAEFASRQSACRMFDEYRDVVLMDCDVTFGSSGAPVFNHKNGRGQIVSLISSIGKFRGKDTSYGMVLPKLVAELKKQMRVNASQPVASARRIKPGEVQAVELASGGVKFVSAGGS
ncbi:trypsin-like serine peptidase [Roseobacter sp.]|uniref:trypsin-like serine peptidase n=1 Tax=Roseobacter sp. TaxID=1907202 RepID=UPI0038596B99